MTSPLAIHGDSEMSQQEAPDPNSMNLEPDTRVVIPYEPPEKNLYEPGEAASIGRIENDEEELLVEPSSFSGEGGDARRWLLAMKAFFWVNKEIFIDQRKVVTAFLNKLNKGRAVHFAERWYTRLLNPEEEISADKCLEEFKETFAPRDIKDQARQDLNSLTMKQFNGDFDQYSIAFKLTQGQSGLDNDQLLVNALQRGVSYQLAVMMTGVLLSDKQRENGWKWEQWLDQAGQFYRNVVQLHNLRGKGEGLGFIPPAPSKPAPPPEDPNAMDVDLLKATSQHEDDALLCSVCHEEGHWTKQQDSPRRKKGNHALPRNLRRKRIPAPDEETPLASYMKNNGIMEERALELLRLFYRKEAYDETSELNRDTSLELPSRATPEILRRGIFIPTTAQPTEGGNVTETVALINSGAMICCVDLEFA